MTVITDVPAPCTVEMAMQIMNLCAIAGVSIDDAKAFVAAKAPLAIVRTRIMESRAAEADELSISTTPPPSSAEQSVADAWDSVVTEQNAKLPRKR